MEIHTLTAFFLWCTILNGGLFLLWMLSYGFAPDLVYRLQNRWFPMPREQFNQLFYVFMGLFKILYLVFNVTPLLALLLIAPA